LALAARVVLVSLALLQAGCAQRPRLAVPAALADVAVVPGFADVRTLSSGIALADRSPSPARLASELAACPAPTTPPHADGFINVLAISGGADGGAYGVGVLHGWARSPHQQLPTFHIVTGISTGAIIAPFAFLGGNYTDTLARLYTSIGPHDVYREKNFLELIGASSAQDVRPLADRLEQTITMDMLRDVADAHARGRRLYVGTTDLDALSLVVWDMGAIASRRTPEALALFRRVILASASVPGAFPPVRIPVEAGGHRYEELHVDGGVLSRILVFGLPPAASANPRTRLYVICNVQFQFPRRTTPLRLLPIASRAVSGLLISAYAGDLVRIHAVAQANGIEFRLAHVPDDYVPLHADPFNTAEMQRLYDLGLNQALQGYPWQTSPPTAPADPTAPLRARGDQGGDHS
jgi:predicted acylesterase/phospholipase RssA